MPNTIAHIAVHTLVTRGILRDADFKWILVGCILSDIPWILQRIVMGLAMDISAIQLRLYAAIQSSLFVTLVLAAGLALLSRRPWRTFALLAFGVVLHLLLDAMQTKWANGVLLFAPFSWDLFNLGLYWPESVSSIAMSMTGVGVMVLALVKIPATPGLPVHRPITRPAASAMLAFIYLLLPFPLMSTAYNADLHYTATLSRGSDRLGTAIEFDRAVVQRDHDNVVQLQAWTGEWFNLQGVVEDSAEVVSVRGSFIAADTVIIEEIFVHTPSWRAIFSQFGLLFIAFWWIRCIRFKSD